MTIGNRVLLACSLLALPSLRLSAVESTKPEPEAPKGQLSTSLKQASSISKHFHFTVVEAGTQQVLSGVTIKCENFYDSSVVVTDAKGQADFELRGQLSPAQPLAFTLKFIHPDYVTSLLEWLPRNEHSLADVPDHFTVALSHGMTLKGQVVDATGNPLANRRLTIAAHNRGSQGNEDSPSRPQRFQGCSIDVPTDETGHFQCSHFPPEASVSTIIVHLADDSSLAFRTGNRSETGLKIDSEDIHSGTIQIQLPSLGQLEGRVTDDKGHPLADATVNIASFYDTTPEGTAVRSDATGTFHLPNLIGQQFILSVSCPGYRTHSLPIDSLAEAGKLQLTLKPTAPLRLHLVNIEGTPVAGLPMTIERFHSGEQILNGTFVSNDQGDILWDSPPDRDCVVMFPVKNGVRLARIKGDSLEQTVVIQESSPTSLAWSFDVRDSVTQAPIPNFEVWKCSDDLKQYNLVGVSNASGHFEASYDAKANKQTSPFTSYRIKIKAKGHKTWISPAYAIGEGDQHQTIALPPGAGSLPPSDTRHFSLERSLVSNPEFRVIGEGLLALRRSEQAVRSSALGLLALFDKQGIPYRQLPFKLQSIEGPRGKVSFRGPAGMLGFPFCSSLHITLHVEEQNLSPDLARFAGDYEFVLPEVSDYGKNWRTSRGLSLSSAPDDALSETERIALEVLQTLLQAALKRTTLRASEDPALEELQTTLLKALQLGGISALCEAVLPSKDWMLAQGRKQGAADQLSLQRYETLRSSVHCDTERLEKELNALGLDFSQGQISLALCSIAHVRSLTLNHSDTPVYSGDELRLEFTFESPAHSRSGASLSGRYILIISDLLRSEDRWYGGQNVHWKQLPDGILTPELKASMDLENYVADHGHLPAGGLLPDFPFSFVADGSAHRSSDYRGKPVVIEFWASWCGPCQSPMADNQILLAAHPEWKDRLSFLTLSVDDTAAIAKEHLTRKGWNQTKNAWVGEGGFQSAAVQSMRIRGVPTLLLVDASGHIVKIGHPGEFELDKEIQALLNPGKGG